MSFFFPLECTTPYLRPRARVLSLPANPTTPPASPVGQMSVGREGAPTARVATADRAAARATRREGGETAPGGAAPAWPRVVGVVGSDPPNPAGV